MQSHQHHYKNLHHGWLKSEIQVYTTVNFSKQLMPGMACPPGGHSQTEVEPMLVRAPQNWTLNGVIPGVRIYL